MNHIKQHICQLKIKTFSTMNGKKVFINYDQRSGILQFGNAHNMVNIYIYTHTHTHTHKESWQVCTNKS